jgi:hypothetical protein
MHVGRAQVVEQMRRDGRGLPGGGLSFCRRARAPRTGRQLVRAVLDAVLQECLGPEPRRDGKIKQSRKSRRAVGDVSARNLAPFRFQSGCLRLNAWRSAPGRFTIHGRAPGACE